MGDVFQTPFSTAASQAYAKDNNNNNSGSNKTPTDAITQMLTHNNISYDLFDVCLLIAALEKFKQSGILRLSTVGDQ